MTVAPFADASPRDVDAALRLARTAHRARPRPSAEARASLLQHVASDIEELGDALIGTAHEETSLPRARLETERGRTAAQLRMFADLVRDGSWREAVVTPALPDRAPAPRPLLRRENVPLGPVVVFGASNFPLAFGVAGGDTASALAAGCPVVVKAHPCHPRTSDLLGRAVDASVRACGLPAGTFALLHGGSPDVGLRLVRHPATAAVAFTGSLRAGRALFDAAAARPRPIPVHAEMGSVNPVLVLPEALAARGDGIAQGLAASFTMGVGQFCTSPGLVLLPGGMAADRFIDALGAAAAGVPAGVMLHPSIRAAFDAALARHAGAPGVRVAARAAAPGDAVAAAVLVTDAAAFQASPWLADEVFGPSILVVICRDVGEMARIAWDLPGQLTATIHAEEGEPDAHPEILDAATEIAGRVVINGFPTGVEVCDAMHHGGPYPASTDARLTSVGPAAIRRFLRPVCYQGLR